MDDPLQVIKSFFHFFLYQIIAERMLCKIDLEKGINDIIMTS